MIPFFLFQTQLMLTVDRIEGNYAIVEWKNGSLGSIERHLLPESLHEGQALILYLKPASKGAATATSTYPAFLNQSASSIALPHPQVLELGHHYHLTIQPLRRTYVEARLRPHSNVFSKQSIQQTELLEESEQKPSNSAGQRASKGMPNFHTPFGTLQNPELSSQESETEDSSLLASPSTNE